jgi:hypothetical protein
MEPSCTVQRSTALRVGLPTQRACGFGRHRTLLLGVLVAWVSAAPATPIPWSGTQTSFVLEAWLLPADAPISAPTAGLDGERVHVRTTASTFALGGAPALAPTDPGAAPGSGRTASAHSADASASVRATELAPEGTASRTSAAVPLLAIEASHGTATEAFTAAPYFARAVADSRTDWSTTLAMAERSGGAPAATTASGPSLAFDWRFNALDLATHSFNAIALIRHRLSVEQHAGDATRVDQLGFDIQILNGRIAIHSSGTVPFAATDWLTTNLSTYRGLVGLWEPPKTRLGVTVPLLEMGDGPADALRIDVRVAHEEISREIPPVAAPLSGPTAGKAVLRDGAISPVLRWDPATGLLSVGTIPVTQRWDTDGSALPPPGPGQDAVHGGVIEIDPLAYLGEAAGLRYFAGDDLRLRGTDGRLLLRAAVPTLVYDPSLEGLQGFTFFAPIMSVIDAELDSSPWLRAFLDNLDFSTPAAPTLALGTPTAKALDWERGFSVGVNGVLSFAGPERAGSIRSVISLPASTLLLAPGLALLCCRRWALGLPRRPATRRQ